MQVYFSQAVSKIERPIKNLIRFEKVPLNPGASATVQFEIPVSDLGYYINGAYNVDAATYTFYVGLSSSDDGDLTTMVLQAV